LERLIKYFHKLSLVIIIATFSTGVKASVIPISFSYTPPPDTIPKNDTSKIDLPYPINEQEYPFDGTGNTGGLYLNDPDNISTTVVYDPVTNEYVFYKKIGDFNYRTPNTMSFEEYLEYDMNKSLKNYFRERSKASGMDSRAGLIPEIRVGNEVFDRIFGGNTIDIRPQGSAELTFGILANNREDPTLDVRQRRTVNFDFDQKIQMSVMAKIGDKIQFTTNYNTEATFDFDNKLKLKYEGKEDEIIKLIEAGDVTLPLTSTLIQGSQSLFGIKTKLQFGRTTVTTVFSQQKSESSNITVEGGATTNTFEFSADQYEENKHFFLSQYAREHYNSSLETLPLVNSPITITKIEVWRTTIGAAVQDNRNIVAFMDLGEYDPYRSDVISPTPGSKQIPSNTTNDLLSQLDYTQIRDINSVSNYLKGTFGFVSGIDFEKVENARKLNASEYTYNSKLGFISLNTSLNSDQVLAVAFQYTVIGDDSIYQVGEFSDEGIESPKCLVVKLLRSTSINTRIPLWDLMMKNVYSIGAYQVNPEDFVLNILYSGGEEGVPTGYITEGDIEGIPLIRALNLDNLDQQLNPPYDGLFDFIDGAAKQGGTIEASNGRIYFTLLEPFGQDLRNAIGDPAIADKYAYDSLYTMTKTGAQQYPDKNKFLLEGFYKSASGSEISLNAMNVPQGSVKVTAGGIVLTENVDYTVDYTLGRVRIINEGILNSGTPINISLESNSLFNIQTRRMMGAHVDYLVNNNLNLGATILNLHERPLTQKVNYGDEPISNTIWGMDFAYQKDSRFVTKAIDALPFYSTKAPSRVTIDGEFAHFIPGHSKAVGKSGTSYIDDFEGSKSTIDLKNISRWFLASTPQGQTNPGMFPEAQLGTGLAYGYNRAKLAWYVIDPLFYDESGNLKPPNIDNNELSKHSVRVVAETEVFPNKEPDNGIPMDIPIFNLAFYPDERGPYNYDTDPTDVSQGIDSDGNLKSPTTRWGGVMRKIETTDFEATNVEYIEFWMMDPFADNPNSNGGQLYFNLGDISEDILRDSRKSYEDGLPKSDIVENVDTTIWGRVPTLQSLVGAFDNDPDSRPYQDVGYEGLRNSDEVSFYDNYLTKVGAIVNLPAYNDIAADPSGDDYHYFRG
jgi:cell surface protein SprA